MWHDFGRDRPVSSLTALEEIPEWDGAGFAPSAALTASPNVFFWNANHRFRTRRRGRQRSRASCGNRGRRTRLQWRLCRLRGCFGFGSFGSQTVPVWIVFIARARRSDYLLTH